MSIQKVGEQSQTFISEFAKSFGKRRVTCYIGDEDCAGEPYGARFGAIAQGAGDGSQ